VVEEGTQLILTYPGTEDVVIYYTTNNTCPCSDENDRKIYDGPVTITEDTFFRIAAWTAAGGYSERLNLHITIKVDDHICKDHLTRVEAKPADCTTDGNIEYWSCSCGKYFEDTFASVEITDIDAWKAGTGKIAAEGHKYTEQKKDPAHLKTEAAKCTEYDVYWYDCSVCDANAKNDPNATDKFWTSTDAGEHKFDEKLTDAAHLVAGSGANCQDVKEYYYDCAHCATIGTTTWASTEVGGHEFDTTQWGYKEVVTGHAHKCKYCNEHDTIQSHTPNMDAPTEDIDKICTACLIVLDPATDHICKSHLTKITAESATCTKDGNIEYYECSCTKYYTDSTAAVEITDKDSVVIKAGHNYGTLIEEVPAKHTADELKAGMKAHYFCDNCSAYFTAEKVAADESDLIIPAPVHEYNTTNGYKKADGHADTCSCGTHNTVVGHTPDREAATETDPIKCLVCGYEITPALGVTTYTVIFAANGGAGSMADVTGISGEYTLPVCTFHAPEGMQFKAWSVNGNEKAVGDKITVTADTNITAVWEDIPVTYYTVTFDSNGGSYVMPQTVATGQKAAKPADPVKNGYTFKGWTLNGFAYNFNTAVTGNITLVASWEENSNIMDDWYWTMIMLYSQKFDITASADQGGVIDPFGVTKVQYSKSITYSITADIGYTIKSVIVDGKDVGAVSTYTFQNVTKNHTIHAVFEQVNPYTDVNTEDWFYEDVLYVTANGLMKGTGSGKFSPEITADRAMLVTVLWRLEGCPIVDSPVDFFDVANGMWYSDAIHWASANGIVKGYGDGTFGPTDMITREQVMTILNRYADYKGWTNKTLLPMLSRYQYSVWAENHVIWGENFGLLDGLGVDLSDMTAKASRAELAAYLSRFMRNIIK